MNLYKFIFYTSNFYILLKFQAAKYRTKLQNSIDYQRGTVLVQLSQ